MAHLKLYDSDATPGGTDGTEITTGIINFDGLPYIPFSDNSTSESNRQGILRLKMLALRCDTGWTADQIKINLGITTEQANGAVNVSNKKLSLGSLTGLVVLTYNGGSHLLFTDAVAFGKYVKDTIYYININNNIQSLRQRVIKSSANSSGYTETQVPITDVNHCFFIGVYGSLWSDLNTTLSISFTESAV